MLKALSVSSALLALFAGLLAISTQSATALPLQQSVLEARQSPTKYIIKYKSTASVSKAERSKWIKSAYGTAGLTMSAAAESKLKLKWDAKVFNGFGGQFSDAAVAALKANPDVEYVVRDTKMYANALKKRNNAPWGLARISHREPLENRDPEGRNFTYVFDDSAGEGVDVYVVDTGVRITHKQFDGRATFGATFGGGTPGEDKNGHGTHCAGTIAGKTVGVARKASIIAVKVLGDEGSGDTSDVISGINFAVESATNSSRPSIISMSLGGSVDRALDDAVRAALEAGVHVIVAAGNEAADASTSSPARVTEAITVGASDINDRVAEFSNFGDIVDIFGPGVDIISASNEGDDLYQSLSGTSMATPHVAGLAAYLIALEGQKTPAELQERIKSLGTANILEDLPKDTVNSIAFNGAGEKKCSDDGKDK